MTGNAMRYYEGDASIEGRPSSGEAFSREGSGSSSSSPSSSSQADRCHLNFHHHHHHHHNEAYDTCEFAPPTDDPEALRLAASLSPNQKNILAHVMQVLGSKTVWEGLLAGKKRQQMQQAAAEASANADKEKEEGTVEEGMEIAGPSPENMEDCNNDCTTAEVEAEPTVESNDISISSNRNHQSDVTLIDS